MSTNTNTNAFRTNDRQILINMLVTMYNNNTRLLSNITDTLNNLNDSNNQIRDMLDELLNVPQQNRNNPRHFGSYERQYRENRRNNRNVNLNRMFINNRPYIIDSITEFTIPIRETTSRNNERQQNQRNHQANSIDTNATLSNLLNIFMQPVEVYPTQSQIETATRRVHYCDIARPINTQCPISLETFNDTDMVTVIRPCGHIFHTEYLMNWFRTNCRCPVCRYDIRDYNSNASTEFFTNTGQQHANTSSRTTYDSSNNTYGNSINRMNSIGSVGSVGSVGSNYDNDIIFNTVNGLIDPSGNSLLGLSDQNIAIELLNAIFRTRYPR